MLKYLFSHDLQPTVRTEELFNFEPNTHIRHKFTESSSSVGLELSNDKWKKHSPLPVMTCLNVCFPKETGTRIKYQIPLTRR